jgi:calcineurin-like phosphoesterase family protein
MARIWVVSDTHFGHANILNFKRDDGTPLRVFQHIHEHDEYLIARWNERVKPEDHVYHLGDVAINRRHLSLISRLMGHKRLVRGNHDIFKTKEYLDAGFDEIYGVRVFRPNDQQGKTGLVLSHIPLHPSSVQRWARNVHGHTHARVVLDENGHPDPRYICVSVEQTGYAPVLLDKL